jgi:hypothetical protein
MQCEVLYNLYDLITHYARFPGSNHLTSIAMTSSSWTSLKVLATSRVNLERIISVWYTGTIHLSGSIYVYRVFCLKGLHGPKEYELLVLHATALC